jgi:hypothetical protein
MTILEQPAGLAGRAFNDIWEVQVLRPAKCGFRDPHVSLGFRPRLLKDGHRI